MKPDGLHVTLQPANNREDWKTLPGLMSLEFCYDIWMVTSEFGCKQHESMAPSVEAGVGGSMVWGDNFLTHFKYFRVFLHAVSMLTHLPYMRKTSDLRPGDTNPASGGVH